MYIANGTDVTPTNVRYICIPDTLCLWSTLNSVSCYFLPRRQARIKSYHPWIYSDSTYYMYLIRSLLSNSARARTFYSHLLNHVNEGNLTPENNCNLVARCGQICFKNGIGRYRYVLDDNCRLQVIQTSAWNVLWHEWYCWLTAVFI